jgi:hypothetical protein
MLLYCLKSLIIVLVLVHIAFSNNCQEKARIITRRNSYDVIWNVQITSTLCSFSFIGEHWYTSGFYRICFWSDVYHLLSSMDGVQLIIKNHTGSPWVCIIIINITG